MTKMQIGWDSELTAYNTGTFLEFPNNPRLLDMNLNSQRKINEIQYQKIHIIIDKGGLKPRELILNGHFQGSTKNTNINKLNNYIFNRDSSDSGLLKFYYTNTKFFYCFGAGMKQTMLGERTNFTDYVANLISPLPFIYSDTKKTSIWEISDAVVTDLATGNKKAGSDDFGNSGSAPCHILEWTIKNGVGGENIEKVEIGDEAGTGSPVLTTINGNKLTWEGTLAAEETLRIYLFKMVDDIFKKLYYTRENNFDGDRDFDGKDPCFIRAEDTSPTFCVKLTGNNVTSEVTAEYRDAYWW
jgi:hypothetical protein